MGYLFTHLTTNTPLRDLEAELQDYLSLEGATFVGAIDLTNKQGWHRKGVLSYLCSLIPGRQQPIGVIVETETERTWDAYAGRHETPLERSLITGGYTTLEQTLHLESNPLTPEQFNDFKTGARERLRMNFKTGANESGRIYYGREQKSSQRLQYNHDKTGRYRVWGGITFDPSDFHDITTLKTTLATLDDEHKCIWKTFTVTIDALRIDTRLLFDDLYGIRVQLPFFFRDGTYQPGLLTFEPLAEKEKRAAQSRKKT